MLYMRPTCRAFRALPGSSLLISAMLSASCLTYSSMGGLTSSSRRCWFSMASSSNSFRVSRTASSSSVGVRLVLSLRTHRTYQYAFNEGQWHISELHQASGKLTIIQGISKDRWTATACSTTARGQTALQLYRGILLLKMSCTSIFLTLSWYFQQPAA